jgi:hypothetical protein
VVEDFTSGPVRGTQIIQICAYDRPTSHRPSPAVSRFPCRPIETKVVALRRTIRLAWAMPMTGPSGLRWQGSGRETVRPLPRWPGTQVGHDAPRCYRCMQPAEQCTCAHRPARRAADASFAARADHGRVAAGLAGGAAVGVATPLHGIRALRVGGWGWRPPGARRQSRAGRVGTTRPAACRRARGGRRRPARDAARGTGSTRRRRRPGRARPRCRGCPTGSGGGRRRRRVVCAALGAAELDTARGHASRLLVVLPTGCRYPFRPPPQAELPGAAPPLGSGTGFAGQRRS